MSGMLYKGDVARLDKVASKLAVHVQVDMVLVRKLFDDTGREMCGLQHNSAKTCTKRSTRVSFLACKCL
jgi:hypothetical protein